MIRQFKTIEELNLYFAQAITLLASNSKNVNPDISQCMLDELMRIYNLNLEILNANLNFTKKIYKQDKNTEQKEISLDFEYEQKRKKFDHKQNKKMQKKLYKRYKKWRRYKGVQLVLIESKKEEIKTEGKKI